MILRKQGEYHFLNEDHEIQIYAYSSFSKPKLKDIIMRRPSQCTAPETSREKWEWGPLIPK